jgi:methionyl-tRNA formyltransferase
MKIMIITEEDEFYLPLSIDYILKNCSEEICEVVCLKNPRLPNKFRTARRFYSIFGFGPVMHFGFKLTKAKILNTFPLINLSNRYYSVKRVCKANQVPYSFCEDVNAAVFLEHCRQLNIELIACVSPSQIFKEKLINLPKYGCINIHTAKLPKYRGLYPTYWAMACGEETVGISIHYIDIGIDTGKIILQDEIDIPRNTTLDYMLKITKLKGAELLVNAIEKISQGTIKAFEPQGEGSYFSYPTPDSYVSFRSHGYKLW